MNIQLLIENIDVKLSRSNRVVIAIDGMAAAGKSTLASKLQSLYSCCVIPMDDFFLRPEQRTPQRLAQPGGNIDYERFIGEVVTPLSLGKAFSYRPYDCGTGQLSDPVSVAPAQLTVIEGVYSLHPKFGDEYYDISVFLEIDEASQRERLIRRSPELYERFLSEWLPLENAYFKHYGIKEKCDYVFNV